MAFEPGAALALSSPQQLRSYGSALRKTGRTLSMVHLAEPLGRHHVPLIQAARRLPRAILVVVGCCAPEAAQALHIDAYIDPALFSPAEPISLQVNEPTVEPRETLAPRLTELLRSLVLLQPHYLFLSERDFEFSVWAQRLVTMMSLDTALRTVPVTRTAAGVAVQPALEQLDDHARADAAVVSAALLAGAYQAEHGAKAVLDAAREVLSTASPQCVLEYLELRDSRTLGPAPERGDARLLAAVRIDGVRLIDNVGVPLGVGFENIAAD